MVELKNIKISSDWTRGSFSWTFLYFRSTPSNRRVGFNRCKGRRFFFSKSVYISKHHWIRTLTLRRSLSAVHVYGRVALLVARVRVVEQQTVGAQFFRELAARGAVVIQVALYSIGIETGLLRTLELVDLLPERRACANSVTIKSDV